MLYDYCCLNPTETTPVLALADALDEQGLRDTASYVRAHGILGGCYGGCYGDADADADADAVGGSDADGGSGSGSGSGGGGDGDGVGVGGSGGSGGGSGYGDGDGGSSGSGSGSGSCGQPKFLPLELIVDNGLYILAIRAGYSPYVLIGQVDRHDFLLRVTNSRVIRRFGQSQQLANLAKTGPHLGTNPTQLLDLSLEEWVPLSAVARAIPANLEAWKAYLA